MSNGDGAEKQVAKLVEQEPEVGVACRKVQVSFFIEQTEDGETVQEFRPEAMIIYQKNFVEPLDLKEMAENICQQVLAGIMRGDVQWSKR